VILFNNAGVSSSSGEVPTSIEGMAHFAAVFIEALGVKKNRRSRIFDWRLRRAAAHPGPARLSPKTHPRWHWPKERRRYGIATPPRDRRSSEPSTTLPMRFGFGPSLLQRSGVRQREGSTLSDRGCARKTAISCKRKGRSGTAGCVGWNAHKSQYFPELIALQRRAQTCRMDSCGDVRAPQFPSPFR
jgi:hypothetical protein